MRSILTTARLRLRPFIAADAPRMAEIQGTWNVTRMLRMAPWPPRTDAMASWISTMAGEWQEGTAYRFAVDVEGRLAGACDVDGIAAGTGDLGYWFDEPYWGCGIAREAARAVVDFSFDDLDLECLTSGHAADNPASGRVLLSLGFRHTGDGEVFSTPRGEMIKQRWYRVERNAQPGRHAP